MKILNLYAGVGGNRKLWGTEHQITAIENEQYIADAYKLLFPGDTVLVADAHEYLLKHHKEFDFIWSSPPCPSHSKASTSLSGWDIYRYPDMKLYEEVIFLDNFFKGKWVVENVIPYYEPLIKPTVEMDRHFFWSNFKITRVLTERVFNVNRTTKETLAEYHNINLPENTKDKRKLLRNCVNPQIGLAILECALNIHNSKVEQTGLFANV